MDVAFHISRAFSIAAFLWFGTTCIFSSWMVAEFERFGLRRFRVLTGVLQLLGAIGLAFGYILPLLVVPASAGLAALMLLGILARLRISDPALAMVPAFLLLAVNAFVLVHASRHGVP